MVLLLLFFNILIIAKYVDCLFHILNRFIKLFWIAERECNKDEMKNRELSSLNSMKMIALFISTLLDLLRLFFHSQLAFLWNSFFFLSFFLLADWFIYFSLLCLLIDFISLFFVTNWFSFLYSFCFLKLYSLLKILTFN